MHLPYASKIQILNRFQAYELLVEVAPANRTSFHSFTETLTSRSNG